MVPLTAVRTLLVMRRQTGPLARSRWPTRRGAVSGYALRAAPPAGRGTGSAWYCRPHWMYRTGSRVPYRHRTRPLVADRATAL